MSQLILFDKNFREIGPVSLDLDAEFGTSKDSKNDFVIKTSKLNEFKPYGGYIPDTEVGGVFEYVKSTSGDDIQTIMGFTWRGLLSKSIITPPAGENYMVVSGEANEILSNMTSGLLGGLFRVPSTQSGLTINSYQFPLYINTLDGLEGMLEKFGYRMKVYAAKQNNEVKVFCEAVEATTIQGVYNEDSLVPMTFESDGMGINHLLCAGQGQLQDRMKVDLYIDENGEVSQTQTFTGFEERTEFYDYGSAESMDDLISHGTERLLELASSRTLQISSPDNVELEIGDRVRGVFQDGQVITSPVVRKIYKIQKGLVKTEVKIKGER